ncbi:hypothetical protein AKJ09_01365 [Labilithrix luteola]|uniref:Uncharacterized protein n=2 Tax=Labilithrix luteola TaxID=1391654 RepID=A0A0K1PMR9_9BACT|nr:hypothetical protein AKJ09_01365 [Labilithrix luteola]
MLGSFVVGVGACNAVIGTKSYVHALPDATGTNETPGVERDGAAGEEGGVSGPCGDVESDRLNCGRCGHDCLGGDCALGKCQPIVLHAGGAPRSIALDADHVYWSDATHALVAKIDKNGANYVELAKGGPLNRIPYGIAVDDKYVYWGGVSSAIVRCAIGGCANTPTLVTSTGPFDDVLVDDHNVYWIDSDGASQMYYVRSIDKGTTNGTGGTVLVGPEPDLFRLAADATHIYVTSQTSSGGAGKLRRVAKTGGKVDVVSSGLGELWGAAVDDSNVYFSDSGDPGTINVASKTAIDAPIIIFASQQHRPTGISLDGTNVYWANGFSGSASPDGALMMCPIASCTSGITLVDHQSAPLTVAVDDKAIYWVNFDFGNEHGAVMKLAKP